MTTKAENWEEILTVLTATERYVRVLAAMQLPFNSFLDLQLDVLHQSSAMLDSMGVERLPLVDLALGDDSTDEILSHTVYAGAPTPIDDGPEGSADDANPLLSDDTSDSSAKKLPNYDTLGPNDFELLDEPSVEGHAPLSGPPLDLTEDVSDAASIDEVIISKFAARSRDTRKATDIGVDTRATHSNRSTAPTPRVTTRRQAPAKRPAPAPKMPQPAKAKAAVKAPPQPAVAKARPAARAAVPKRPAAKAAPVAKKAQPTSQRLAQKTKARTKKVAFDENAPTPISPQRRQKQVVVHRKGTPTARPPLADAATFRPPQPRISRPSPTRSKAAVKEGLYGNSGITERSINEAKPVPAAIKLNQHRGTSKVLRHEEEMIPIPVDDADDYDLNDDDDGFSLQEYNEEEEEEAYFEKVEEELTFQPAPTMSHDALNEVLRQAMEAQEAGRMDEATGLFSDILDAQPQNSDIYVARGRLQLDMGDYARALSDFTLAAEAAPDSPEPQVAIGDLYFARKDYGRAIDLFDAALDLAPNHGMAYCRRGISHYYRRDYQQSLDDLNRAQDLDPDIPHLHTYISMAKKKT
ncbi:MAG: tetratricopeptide repeat protein [Proteobacteria bacterium]|nr:tetratricopeptide repeat protein [Pseudomonadota bacterium]